VNALVKRKWASIYANENFICFQTCSGLRRSAIDSAGKTLLARPSDGAALLGAHLMDALGSSRFLEAAELGSFFDVASVEVRYKEWVATLMSKYEYQSRKDLFRGMKHCPVDQSGGFITLRPTNHEKLEAWSGDGVDSSQYVQVPEQSSEQEIGQAVLLALSRCIG